MRIPGGGLPLAVPPLATGLWTVMNPHYTTVESAGSLTMDGGWSTLPDSMGRPEGAEDDVTEPH